MFFTWIQITANPHMEEHEVIILASNVNYRISLAFHMLICFKYHWFRSMDLMTINLVVGEAGCVKS